jgi:hypothetical protein
MSGSSPDDRLTASFAILHIMNPSPLSKRLQLVPGLLLAVLLLTPSARNLLANLSLPVTLVVLGTLAATMIGFRKRLGLAWAAMAAALVIIAAPMLPRPTPTPSHIPLAAHDHDHDHDHGHGHQRVVAAPSASQILQRVSETGVDQTTRFDFVVTFEHGVPKAEIEAFLDQVIRRVHVQGCVRNLPCIARMLRLFEIGAKRKQVIAFDVMPDITLAERAALTTAIQINPLSPGVHFSMSALQASSDP